MMSTAPRARSSPSWNAAVSEAGFAGRRVVVHVAGSIAAIRSTDVVTALRREGAEVRVATTRAGARLVSPVALRALSGHPVERSLWRPAQPEGHGMAHVDLGQWGEAHLVVGASADLMAKLALGLADDPVTATLLSTRAPIVAAPAMEPGMWEHPATRRNAATLRERGVQLVGPVSGRLASGDEGLGRMAPVDDLIAALRTALGGTGQLAGLRIVVTAGGTREPIDAVRHLGNRSSGRMGHALAEAARDRGAAVLLITTAPESAPPGVEVVGVETAEQLHEAVTHGVAGARVLLMAAAVADHRPAQPADGKVHKGAVGRVLELEPTTDVLADLAARPRNGLMVVGFAAETDDVEDSALTKLRNKRMDLVVANDVSGRGVGMGAAENAVTILDGDGVVARIARAPKRAVAAQILDEVGRRL
jgi:phosphopantothenoylcysteine decarboxylase/phosphopantothenate--cysteine ligase